MNIVTKGEYDRFVVNFDYSPSLASDEEVVDYEITAINTDSGLASAVYGSTAGGYYKADGFLTAGGIAEADSIVSSFDIDGTVFGVTVQGGNDGEYHKVSVTALTSFDNRYQMTVFVHVLNKRRERIEKWSDEEFITSYDFSKLLQSEKIASYTVTATDADTGDDVTNTIIEDTEKQADKVFISLTGGTSTKVYLIDIKIDSDAFHRYSARLALWVK